MNKNEFIIKRASVKDCDVVAALVVELLVDLNSTSTTPFVINRDAYKQITEQYLNDEDGFTAFLAYDKDEVHKPIGVITIVKGKAIYNLGDFGIITELFILPEFRSKGVGALLIGKAKQYCKLRGWRKLEVGAPSVQARPLTFEFYKKNNFIEKGPKLRLEI